MYGSYSLSRSWVFRIILITSIIFLLQILQPFGLTFGFLVALFGLVPAEVAQNGFVWQLFTYMFLHGDPMHLLFNMYGIFIFGMLLVEAMPLVVEMGVLLDLFVAIFVICIIVNQINQAFSSLDTRRLVSLKE